MEMDQVHVWLASFTDEQEVDSFFEETYTDNDDDPISAFAASQDECFYDHDWVFTEFDFKDGIAAVLNCLYDMPDQLKAAVNESLDNAGFEPNAIIVSDIKEVTNPHDKTSGPPRLKYIGIHKYGMGRL